MIQNNKNVIRKKKKGEQQFLKNAAVVIVMQIICAAFYDPKRNKICRIFIPGDGRMFDKFLKTLKKYMIVTGKVFVAGHKGESKKLLNSQWFHRYLQYQTSVQDIYDYVTETLDGKGERKIPFCIGKCAQYEEKEDEAFLDNLVRQTRKYVDGCVVSALAEKSMAEKSIGEKSIGEKSIGEKSIGENRLGENRENPLAFAKDEKKLLWDFYWMIMNAVRSAMSDIEPTVKSVRVDRIKDRIERNLAKEENANDAGSRFHGMDEEVRSMLIHNLKNEKLENDEMWWHIRCCIDYEIWDCQDVLVNVARNNQWKAWVRQTAVEYVCRTMEVGEACEKLLSGLYGKLFYWTVAQFADSRDERLKEAVNGYAQRYNGQEMLRDVCLMKMQDRGGLERIRHYLERMRHVPKTIENPDLIQVIGEIKDVELLDEWEKLLDLLMKDNFRDREYNGLAVSLARAMVGVASCGQQEKERIFSLLEQKRISYQKQYEDCLYRLEQIRAEREPQGKSKVSLPVAERLAEDAVEKANQKRVFLKQLTEDVKWRCRESD